MIPSEIVVMRAVVAIFISFFRNEWCDHVIVAPEDSKIIEFSNGILIGLNTLMLTGGQFIPSSILGEILLWKKAQKRLKNNITSERMNMIILLFRRFITVFECVPCIEDSRVRSRHHKNLFIAMNVVIKINVDFLSLFFLMFAINVIAVASKERDARIGHGLGDTIWNG